MLNIYRIDFEEYKIGFCVGSTPIYAKNEEEAIKIFRRDHYSAKITKIVESKLW